MPVLFSRRFSKRRDKLPRSIQEKLSERLRLFGKDPFHPLLNNHSVHEVYPGWRSINVTGDYRALYEEHNRKLIFMTVGTHSELYD